MMTLDRLNELYFAWLVKQVHFKYKENYSLDSFQGLMTAFWHKPYSWTVSNDDNRLEDGLELRYLFLIDEENRNPFVAMGVGLDDRTDLGVVADFRAQRCTFLEVLVALSKRLAFQSSEVAGWWAWKLIDNLGLAKMKDPLSSYKQAKIDDTLERVIWRTYQWDGIGGFFPLSFPTEDQRKVEVWYQMAAYVNENNY